MEDEWPGASHGVCGGPARGDGRASGGAGRGAHAARAFLFDALGDRAGRVLAGIDINYRGDLDTQFVVEAVAREWKERSTDRETLEMLLEHPSVEARRVLLVGPEEFARMDDARRRLYTEIILPRLSRDQSRTIRADAAALLAGAPLM